MNKSSEIYSVADRLVSLVLNLTEEQQKALLDKLKIIFRSERRQSRRRSFGTVVAFVTKGRAYREFSKDFSSSGVYIETSGAFSVGQEVVMTFSFPDPQKHVRVIGRVARVDDSGIGIAFNMKSLSGEEIELKSFVSKTASFHPLP